VVNYRRYLRDFLIGRGDAVSPAELVTLSADDLLAFSRQRGAGLGRTAWNHLATVLSGFYRWLDLCGHGGAQLVGAVPLRRRCRLADVPCALSWEQVRRPLGAVDLREPNGRRNYAMLLPIASYGLRGCEVRALRLNDIDWAHDEIVIFAPKTGRRRALPLTRPRARRCWTTCWLSAPRRGIGKSSCPAGRRMARCEARSTRGRGASWTRRAS